MKVFVGTTDGQTHESVEVTDAQIRDELERSGGHVGTGYLDDVVLKTPADFKQFMRDFLKNDNLTHITLNTAEGEKVFRAEHVIWTRVDD